MSPICSPSKKTNQHTELNINGAPIVDVSPMTVLEELGVSVDEITAAMFFWQAKRGQQSRNIPKLIGSALFRLC